MGPIYICNHENNVPSRLSPKPLCGNWCTWAHDVWYVVITGTVIYLLSIYISVLISMSISTYLSIYLSIYLDVYIYIIYIQICQRSFLINIVLLLLLLLSSFMNIYTGLVLKYKYCYQYMSCCLIKNVKNIKNYLKY